MQYTPRDILNYVYEKELDTQFFLATANHVQDFSIGEITDKKIEKRGEDFYLVSKSYHLDIKITDDEVMTAAINGLYISAFISRKDDNYRVHFLVHQYPDQMKARFEEEITKDVVDYIYDLWNHHGFAAGYTGKSERIFRYITDNGYFQFKIRRLLENCSEISESNTGSKKNTGRLA